MELAAEIERQFGSPVVDSKPGPAPGGSKNRTSIIELQSGRRLVVQQYTNARTAAVRLRAVEQLATPLNQHGIPVPRLLINELADEPPWAAFEELPGEPGYVAAGWDLEGAAFPTIASDMGTLLRRMAELDPSEYDLPSLWTEPVDLMAAAHAWLAALEPYLSSSDVAIAQRLLATTPALLGNRPVVVCHGDFGPQNVLVLDGRVSGLLDFEDVRIADPLLDVAWWAWFIRAHTPAAFTRTWDRFLNAAGVDRSEAQFDDRVMLLIVLRLLETADGFREAWPEKHPSWGRRLSATLEWRGTPLSPHGS